MEARQQLFHRRFRPHVVMTLVVELMGSNENSTRPSFRKTQDVRRDGLLREECNAQTLARLVQSKHDSVTVCVSFLRGYSSACKQWSYPASGSWAATSPCPHFPEKVENSSPHPNPAYWETKTSLMLGVIVNTAELDDGMTAAPALSKGLCWNIAVLR